jgi:hypothetical protein
MSTDLQPSVAVVILNYNTANLLERFLPEVLNSTYSNLKVVVADNASEDNSVQLVQEQFPEVTVIPMKENTGYAGGYNECMQSIDSKYSILLNTDVSVRSDWIEPMVELAERNPQIAAIQPKILDYKEPELFEYAGASGGFLDRWGYPFCRGRMFDTLERDTGQYETEIPVFWASGAALFIKTETFHQLGAFDATFFAHMEEIDLCWRIQNDGKEVWVQPQSVVYHIGGGTLAEGSSRKYYLNYRNNLLLLLKNLPRKGLWLKIFFRLVLDGVSAVNFLISGKAQLIPVIIKAHWNFFGQIPRRLKQRKELEQSPEQKLHGYYHGSIVYQYFLKKKKRFSDIYSVEN